MLLSDRLALGLRLAFVRGATRRRMGLGTLLPLLIAVATVAGICLVLFVTPVAGRGDYGQWLMTSRYYLGEGVPGYRNIQALPPLVPIVLAGIQFLVRDAEVALQLTTTFALVAVSFGLYLAGSVLGRSRDAGALAVAVGLLVTDRYLELFAFGGLLQAVAVAFMILAVVAFVAAAREPDARRWWLLGSVSLGAAALSHVGTGMIAVPVGLSAAALAVLPLRRRGWRAIALKVAPLMTVLVIVGIYWLIVLLPASTEYVKNPASLAYRGPDRLMSGLFAYWPTGLVVIAGTVATLGMLIDDVIRRRIGAGVLLGAWLAVAWGTLAFSAVSGAATDYPRFATVLMAPLVIAVGVFVTRATAFAATTAWRASAGGHAMSVTALVVVGVVVVAAPFAVTRYSRVARVYQPHDAVSLTAAVHAADEAIPATASVLTSVRDGKWLEGLTGREALFSLPVRYAFRPDEWQRSVDADTLLRSNGTLTNGFFEAQFTAIARDAAASVPEGLLVSVNHGGEFVDLLKLGRGDTTLLPGPSELSASRLDPERFSESIDATQASVTSRWRGRTDPGVSLLETVRVWDQGTTLDLVDEVASGGIRKVLRPADGTAFTTIAATGTEADICFAKLGDSQPCVRVWAAQPDATFVSSPSGLSVQTSTPRLELHITALTAGQPSVGLGYLDPQRLVDEYHVAAALLWAADPATGVRLQRLRALGFDREIQTGSYVVAIRSTSS
jgi:hypothetical protein